MSTVKYKASKAADYSVDYAFYGDSGEMKAAHLAAGTSRVSAFRSSFGDAPTEAVRDMIVAAAEGHGRKIQLHTYTLSFRTGEFDVTNPEHLDRVAAVGEKLVKRMHSAGYAVVVHDDADGGHAHAHIYVINHDDLTGKSLQRYTSWKKGLRQLNDELMRSEGLDVLPDPEREKPEWIQRREDFAPGGFEQTLGDRVAAALRDPRSVDREHFEAVLGEHGVTLAVTGRDGWSYKMRRTDTGKLGRKKASGLTPEFTAEGAQERFDFNAQRAALAARERDEDEREQEEHDGHLGRHEGAAASDTERTGDGQTDEQSSGRRGPASVDHRLVGAEAEQDDRPRALAVMGESAGTAVLGSGGADGDRSVDRREAGPVPRHRVGRGGVEPVADGRVANAKRAVAAMMHAAATDGTADGAEPTTTIVAATGPTVVGNHGRTREERQHGE